jgi:hypothetical protein
MKKLILISFVAILISCNHNQSETNDLLGNWISVKTDGIDSSGYVILNGYLLHVTENKYSYSNIFKDTIISTGYSIENDTIYFDDSTNIEIESTTKDSIKLIFRNSGSIVTYIKLPYTSSNEILIDNEVLTSNSWNYILDTIKQRIEFLNNDWTFYNDDSKDLYTHPIAETPYYYPTNNRWRIFNFMNRTYIARTFGYYDGLLHEIFKVTDDTIFTKAWTGSRFEFPIIVKIKPIRQNLINQKHKIIINNTWRPIEIKYQKGLLPDWQIPRVETRLYNAINKWNLRFEFKPKTCQIMMADTSFNFPNWNLTKDGEYFRFDSKFDDANITSFIKIEKITNDTLILKNRFLFSEILGLNTFDYLDLTIKLIR